MTGGNEGGRPLTKITPNPGQPQEPGSQVGSAGHRDQLGQNLEREDEMNRRRTRPPDGSPAPDNEDRAGTLTNGPGNEGTTRY